MDNDSFVVGDWVIDLSTNEIGWIHDYSEHTTYPYNVHFNNDKKVAYRARYQIKKLSVDLGDVTKEDVKFLIDLALDTRDEKMFLAYSSLLTKLSTKGDK